MAFHFSLESILGLRRGQERAERLKLEAIISEMRQTRARLAEVIERSLDSRRQFQQELTGGLTGSEVQFQITVQSNTASVRVALEKRLVQLEQNRMAQFQVFFKSRQRREILENLRARKFDLYALEQSRREQQELDDLFLMRQEIVRGESNSMLPGR